MAGNPKTSKSVAPKTAQMKPGSKGVMVNKNPKATVQSSAVGMKKKK
ncbi:MAG: hypothetical protein ACK52I_10170 [Pseudomonadota bacterium]|jgi:hypothetical protein